jgi:hypothetical protein
MGLLDRLKNKLENTFSESRLEEELIYKHILMEMESGVIREGLYAKALANSPGDEDKAKSLYMKYRVRSIKDALDGRSFTAYVDTVRLNANKMLKGELISYAEKQGVTVNIDDTKAKIIEKLP